jgi:hypothetical protein
MKSMFKKILVSVVCLAMLGALVSVQMVFAVGEWEIGDYEGNSVEFSFGEEATISLEFDEPIKFTGNWTGITTDIPVEGDTDAESTGAIITAFILDGEDLGEKAVPVIDRDDSGLLTIDIARQWAGDYDDFEIAGREFSSIEITFIVPNAPDSFEDDTDTFTAKLEGQLDVAPDEPDDAQPVEISSEPVLSGNAWIGGTFIDECDDEDCECSFGWIEFTEQSTAFEVGEPFTVTLDFGSQTNTHGEAHWGYITVVQTDMMSIADNYDAFINSVRVDGEEILFNNESIEISVDDGIRISLTNTWSNDPVILSHDRIGEFYKLEVEMAFMLHGEQAPYFPANEGIEPVLGNSATVDADDDVPVFVIIIIAVGAAAAVIAVILIIVALSKKKK